MTQLSPSTALRNGLRLLRVLVPLSLILTIYLYLFPLFLQCAFPLPQPDNTGVDTGSAGFRETARLHYSSADGGRQLAPFRLLALGDPQLEGDTSIPNARGKSFPHLSSLISRLSFRTAHHSLRERVRQSLHDTVDFYFEDIPNTIESIRKRIDLFGNDFYLAHIYRTVRWWTQPTHITVLGDLVGSQWLDDDEFDRRSQRYWTRVFRGGERVPDDVARLPGEDYDLAGVLGQFGDNETAEAWRRRVINVAGNHDIGYAGDINDERFSRFERAFGKANYELRFELPVTNTTLSATLYDEQTNPDSPRLVPEIRVVVLNDMNLDTPALSTPLQDATYAFVNSVINTASAVEFAGHLTVVLTHIPLYKPEGVCVDAPFFDFHEHDGTLKEQNQLSADASRGFLEGIYGMNGDRNAPGAGRGRPGVILNGHDHEGCDTWHFINQSLGGEDRKWEVRRWREAKEAGLPGREGLPGIREVTVRSMMGDFGGNAGLLSAWFDEKAWEWRFEYATCAMGTQHLWWLVHILDLATVLVAVGTGVLAVVGVFGLDKSQPVPGQDVKNGSASGKKLGKRGAVNGCEVVKKLDNGAVKGSEVNQL
ncbi:Protein TED1 [Coniochaeta hoffmannii]|uniref:Protein TED1 n=1 Tax=Coniochaeta hoffmannii TaxID=91930 RepID=A0AA38S424_9PEZI|nr:Protein TED1 [Coniochaeta hoffmannii]